MTARPGMARTREGKIMSQTNILLETGTNELEIVEFYIEEPEYRGYYGVNVAKVLEIIRLQPITNLPQAPHPAVMGAFSHRDRKVIPLINLGLFLGKDPILGREPKIILTEFNTVITGFVVSGVNRIHRISWTKVEAPGRFLQELSQNSITGVVRLEGRVVFILDMENIVSEMHPDLSIFMDAPLPAPVPGTRTVYTILHADDSGSVRKLVYKLLEESGRFKVIQCSDGQEAWDTLLSLKKRAEDEKVPLTSLVQAVITDIEMPRLDGLTLCRQIKEDPALKTLPVALFSSLISEKLEHKGLSVGADAQFAKPDLQSLSTKLLGLLEKKKL